MPASNYHYVVEYPSGNTHQYSFDIERSPDKAVDIIKRLRDEPKARLHVYKLVSTVSTIENPHGSEEVK